MKMWPPQEGATLRLTNTLRSGETVGDLDVLDGAQLACDKSTGGLIFKDASAMCSLFS